MRNNKYQMELLDPHRDGAIDDFIARTVHKSLLFDDGMHPWPKAVCFPTQSNMQWLFGAGDATKHDIQQCLAPVSWHSWPDGHAVLHAFRSTADSHMRTGFGIIESLSKVAKFMAQVALCIIAPPQALHSPVVSENQLSSFTKLKGACQDLKTYEELCPQAVAHLLDRSDGLARKVHTCIKHFDDIAGEALRLQHAVVDFICAGFIWIHKAKLIAANRREDTCI